jgi:hypothetical protein
MARPSGIEAEEPGESPVLLGIQKCCLEIKISPFSFLQGWQWSSHWGSLERAARRIVSEAATIASRLLSRTG